MSPILLRIVLHGMIALVPFDSATNANRMTALLVDAHAFPADVDPVLHPGALPLGFEQCFVPHMPMLSVKTKTAQECVAVRGCRIESNLCNCMLSRQDLSLEVTPALNLAMRSLDSPHGSFPLPFDQNEAASFRYIGNLTEKLNQQLDPRFLDTVPPNALVARMAFPFESAVSCSLALRSDEGSRNVHALSFRTVGTLEGPGEVSQALAQQVVSTLTIPEQATIAIRVKDFATGTEQLLNLDPTANGYRIDLSNMRETEMLIDDPCDDGIARDFAFFYELALNKPAWKDRKVPHIKLSRWKSSSDLDPKDCIAVRDHAPSSRPICPMGSFAPPGIQP